MTALLAALLAAAPLNYRCTWLGNSFGGGDTWVQNFCEAVVVAPDGTVFLASGWDEAGREYGAYRDGRVIGAAGHTHGWGYNGGQALAIHERYVFLAQAVDNEGGNLVEPSTWPAKDRRWYGLSRRRRDDWTQPAPFAGGLGGGAGDTLRGAFRMIGEVGVGEPGGIAGLACGDEQVYVSDPVASRIRVLSVESMREVGGWTLPRCGGLAMAPDGTLWALRAAGDGLPARLLHYAADGTELPEQFEFAADQLPRGPAVDPRDAGRLLVADGGPAQQIVSLRVAGGRITIDATIGERGGMAAGPTPGAAGPLRFPNPTGVGIDAEGHLYVGCNQPGGGTVLRSFAPDGALRWELLGLEFVDTAEPVPGTDATDVFTTENRYTLDWTRAEPGGQWTWRSQTVDPFRYPDDPRLHEGHHHFTNVLYRVLGGRPFLVVRGMFQRALLFCRLEGETAVPSVMFCKGPFRADGWSPPGMPADGRWIWRDLDGDGQFAAAEFLDADGVNEPESWAWWVDEAGDVWQGDQTGPEPIRRYAFGGLDARGNPIYSRAESETIPLPAPLNHLLRLEYHPAEDLMYLTGHTTDRPKTGGEWGQCGTEAWRIDGWSRGNRAPRWRVELPYNPAEVRGGPNASAPNTTIKSFCTTTDFVFGVESRSARVHVWRASDGTKLGELAPGPEVAGESGWVDFPDAIRAVQRADGEVLIFVEEDWKGKVIIYRWRP